MFRADPRNSPFSLYEPPPCAGVPSDALIYMLTAEGPKPVVLVEPTYVNAAGTPTSWKNPLMLF